MTYLDNHPRVRRLSHAGRDADAADENEHALEGKYLLDREEEDGFGHPADDMDEDKWFHGDHAGGDEEELRFE
jgi:hypothetical protein